jgi:hypothetical protein
MPQTLLKKGSCTKNTKEVTFTLKTTLFILSKHIDRTHFYVFFLFEVSLTSVPPKDISFLKKICEINALKIELFQ